MVRPSFVLRFLFSLSISAFVVGCGDDDPPPVDGGMDATVDSGPMDPPPPAPFESVEQTARYEIPGLTDTAFIVRTEHDVPHVYATNRLDAYRLFGFAMAKDRFFQMDLTRRLAQGTISEVLGDAALETDLENREIGGGLVTDLFLEGMNADETAEVDAFAEGVNAYIELVRQRRLFPPKEYNLAATLLGMQPIDFMEPFTRRDVASAGAAIMFETSFEGGDVSRNRAFEQAADLFAGAPDQALREAGLQQEVIDHYAPAVDSSSAAGWGVDTGTPPSAIIDTRRRRPTPIGGLHVERGVYDRLERSLERIVSRYSRSPGEGYGSNAWAVAGTATANGASILAGDGHLQLDIPSLFWRYGMDTELLGDGTDDMRMIGSTIPGLPLMGTGTNGKIAWTQTAFFADVTDWYREELLLDAEGLPRATMFLGAEVDLVRVDESYEVRGLPEPLGDGSPDRTEVIPRWETPDGRLINSIEGREVTADEPLGAGESRVRLNGTYVVPGDEDGDGTITAISVYYGPYGGGTLLRAFRKFGLGETVEDFRQAMRHFIGYGGAMTATDSAGSVFHSAYHAVPCRDYLPRDPGTNVWIDGADPRKLLDGTTYGTWDIPLDAEGRVDEAAATGPEQCAVPFDQWPQALDPARQYVHHANNDPGNITTDNSIFDDPYYIGGAWIEGYRARRIEQLLQEAIAGSDATLERMQAMQGDHHSNLGEEWLPYLLEFIDAAQDAAAGTPAAGSPEERMAAMYTADSAAFDEVESRMMAWRDAGFPTPSGVETFYHTPAAGDGEHAVATTLFAAWFPRFLNGVLDDEGISDKLSPAGTGGSFRMVSLKQWVLGRGPGNPLGLASWDATREESVFFDDVNTAETESSQEMGVRALTEALAFLRSDPTAPGEGGFGSTDMDDWVWGLRHQVRFESLIGGFLGGDDSFDFILSSFKISTDRLPLADGLADTDPRFGITWFPRPGDQFDIDAANPDFSGTRFTHGSGPVFRMVIELGPDGVRGENIVPGGQSGNPDVPTFDDQVQLWLANETTPMRYLPDEVAAGAVGLERYVPAP